MRAKKPLSQTERSRIFMRPQAIDFLPPLALLIMGLLIQGFAHADLFGVKIIGEGVIRSKEKDYPALCKIQVESRDSDQVDYCSGTLVGPNEIATGAHCFGRYFNSGFGKFVRAYCGGRSANVKEVSLPPDDLWVDDTKPYGSYDYARVSLKKPLDSAMPKATKPDWYFQGDGKMLAGVRCWIAGFGHSRNSDFGTLNIAEVTNQTILYESGLIVMRDSQSGVLKTSVDHGDSGGAFYCQSPGHATELVAVIVSYRAEKRRDRNRMENEFAPIWSQTR